MVTDPEYEKKTLRLLRKAANPKAAKVKSWIAELDDDMLFKLYELLKEKRSYASIAKMFRDDFRIIADRNMDTARKKISFFHKRVKKLKKKRSMKKSSEDQSSDYNPLKQMIAAAEIQRKRIERFARKEKRDKSLSGQMDRMLEKFLTMNKEIVAAKSKLLPESEDEKPSKFPKGLKFDDPETVEEAMHNFLIEAEEKSLLLERGPDGEYILPEDEKNAGS